MAEKASWPLTEKCLHGTYHDGEMVFWKRPGGLLSHCGDLKYYSLYVELSIKIYITKSRKIDPIFEFTVASSELSITNLHQQIGDMVGLCGTSLIWSWGKVQKWTVPDLRKTNQTIPQWHIHVLCLIAHIVCVNILGTKLNMIVFVYVLGELKDFRRNWNPGCAERRNKFHPTAQTNKQQECSRNERQKPPEKEVGGWDKETELS